MKQLVLVFTIFFGSITWSNPNYTLWEITAMSLDRIAVRFYDNGTNSAVWAMPDQKVAKAVYNADMVDGLISLTEEVAVSAPEKIVYHDGTSFHDVAVSPTHYTKCGPHCLEAALFEGMSIDELPTQEMRTHANRIATEYMVQVREKLSVLRGREISQNSVFNFANHPDISFRLDANPLNFLFKVSGRQIIEVSNIDPAWAMDRSGQFFSFLTKGVPKPPEGFIPTQDQLNQAFRPGTTFHSQINQGWFGSPPFVELPSTAESRISSQALPKGTFGVRAMTITGVAGLAETSASTADFLTVYGGIADPKERQEYLSNFLKKNMNLIRDGINLFTAGAVTLAVVANLPATTAFAVTAMVGAMIGVPFVGEHLVNTVRSTTFLKVRDGAEQFIEDLYNQTVGGLSKLAMKMNEAKNNIFFDESEIEAYSQQSSEFVRQVVEIQRDRVSQAADGYTPAQINSDIQAIKSLAHLVSPNSQVTQPHSAYYTSVNSFMAQMMNQASYGIELNPSYQEIFGDPQDILVLSQGGSLTLDGQMEFTSTPGSWNISLPGGGSSRGFAGNNNGIGFIFGWSF